MDDLVGLMLASAAAVVAMMVGVWLLSLAVRDASIVDSFWGLGFVLVAAVALALGPGVFDRRLLLFALVGSRWGLEKLRTPMVKTIFTCGVYIAAAEMIYSLLLA